MIMSTITPIPYDEDSLRINPDLVTIGLEQEYAFLDCNGYPIYFVQTPQGLQATWVAIKDYIMENYEGGLKEHFSNFVSKYDIAISRDLVPEVFKNMIEVVGVVAQLHNDDAINDLVDFHVYLFELICKAAENFGLQLMDPSSFDYRRIQFGDDWENTISVEPDHPYYPYYKTNIKNLIAYTMPHDNSFVPWDAARYPMGTATHATVVWANNIQTKLIYGAQRAHDAPLWNAWWPESLDMSPSRYQWRQKVTVAARVALGWVLHGDNTISPIEWDYLQYSDQRYHRWLNNPDSKNFYFGGKDHSMIVTKPVSPNLDPDRIGPESRMLGVERRASDNRPTRWWVEAVIRNHVAHVRAAIDKHNIRAYDLAQEGNAALYGALQ